MPDKNPEPSAEFAPGPQQYIPELWTVKKDDFYACVAAINNGLEYARECRTAHDDNLGRTTLKNKIWGERMDEDIRKMEQLLSNLSHYSAHTMPV